MNEFIKQNKPVVSNKMHIAMSSDYGEALHQEDGENLKVEGKIESGLVGNKLRIKGLKLYCDRIYRSRPENISVSLLNVVKVCKIVEK